MTKWEYQTIEVPYGPHGQPAQLQALGAEGWEAVGIHLRAATDNDSAGPNPFILTVLLKRQKLAKGGSWG